MIRKLFSEITGEFSRLNWTVAGLFVLLILLELAVALLLASLFNEPLFTYIPIIVASLLLTILIGGVLGMVISQRGEKLAQQVTDDVESETRQMRIASDRAQALQAMASTLRATLSFEKVVDAALDVCGLALEEVGVPARSLIGAVYLFEEEGLLPISSRNFYARDEARALNGNEGVIFEALGDAEMVTTTNVAGDPQLSKVPSFQSCQAAVVVPLRAGFSIFGVMVLGTDVPITFGKEQLSLFNSVADHTVIALQNAKLYQDLRAEKAQLIAADEAARRELARDLHDGPTQAVAAIAMRVNYVRSLLRRDPEQALDELAQIETLARETAKDIRGMLFSLRPVVLETDGLHAALENVVERHRELTGANVRLIGQESADELDSQAQSMVFAIVDEALSNSRKHANARNVDIRMWQEKALFVAEVKDDGAGFDVDVVRATYRNRGSLGMLNMKERAERIDGSLRIESVPGEGTTVTIVVPLELHGRPTPNGHYAD